MEAVHSSSLDPASTIGVHATHIVYDSTKMKFVKATSELHRLLI